MPMFDSDEAFNAYVAQQQADLAGDKSPESQPAPTAASGLEQWQKVLGLVVPLALAAVVGIAFWQNAPDGKSQYNDPWDKIFSATAWIGGRKYNADAGTLTDRMTFSEPLEKQGSDD